MTTRQISYRLKSDGKAEVKRDLVEVGEAGQVSGQAVARGWEQAGDRIQQATTYTERQLAQFKRLSEVARTEEERERRQAAFNNLLGVGQGTGLRRSDFLSGDEVDDQKGRMTRSQRAGRLNLLRQGADVFTTGAMGMDPGMIAIQQGPQILDALATSGFKASGSLIAVAAGVAAVAAGVGVAAVAAAGFEKNVNMVEGAVRGMGAASGVSSSQLQDLARAHANAGEVSTGAAREMATSYVETGRIGGQVLGELIEFTKSYAVATHQDLQGATKDLSKYLADPAKGVHELNERFSFLTAAQEEQIISMARTGRTAEAQTAIIKGLKEAIAPAAQATAGWAYVFDGLKRSISNATSELGRWLAVSAGGGALADRLKEAQTQLAFAQNAAIKDPVLIDQRAARVRSIQAEIAAEAKRIAGASATQPELELQALRDQYNPTPAQLAKLKADRKRLVDGGTKDTDPAIKAIDEQINALNAGYRTAQQHSAALAREARKAAAEGRKDAQEERKEAREAEREAEEAERRRASLLDHINDNARRIAEARGDASTLDLLDRENRLLSDINRFKREGLDLAQAEYWARKQMGDELEAEAARRRDEVQKAATGLKVAPFVDPADIVPFNAKTKFMEDLRLETGGAFRDGLVGGMTGGNFFEIFAQRLKYAAASGLADSLTNSVFGKADGSKPGALSGLFEGKSGWLDRVLKFIPGFAGGTDSAPAGWAWVGEEGPELRKLRSGDQIKSHSSSIAMVQQANMRSMGSPAAFALPSIQFHNHGGAQMDAQVSQGEDGGLRVDLYEAAGRDMIMQAGRDGTLGRAAKAAPRRKKYA